MPMGSFGDKRLFLSVPSNGRFLPNTKAPMALGHRVSAQLSLRRNIKAAGPGSKAWAPLILLRLCVTLGYSTLSQVLVLNHVRLLNITSRPATMGHFAAGRAIRY